ncbi:MAG: hypothetical protein WED34_11885 [Planctomycetales bacterium]
MTSLPRPLPWLEKAGDFANAILVKETRQSLKSRQFIATFLLLLGGAWLVSVFFMLEVVETIETAPVGGRFFYAFFFVLLVAIFVVVPFGAFRSLLAEREQNTFDVLSITTLSPGQIVRGKLLSAVVQMFLFYSAIAPFIAFASLLQGFDLPQVAFVLALAGFVSLGCAMFGLLLATLSTQRHWQVLLSLFLLGALTCLLYGFYSDNMAGAFADAPLREREFWWVVACFLVAWLTYFVLFFQLAVARLTFEADNRSTGIRATCSAQFWLLWGILWAICYFSPSPALPHMMNDFVMTGAFLSGLHWLIVGIPAATEGPRLSRRTRRRLPRNPLLRLVLAPLLPGGDRGLLYVLLHAGALVAIVRIFPHLLPSAASLAAPGSAFYPPPSYPGATSVLYGGAVAAYLAIFVGIASLFNHWGSKLWRQFRPSHARLAGLLALLGGILLPSLARLFLRYPHHEYQLIDVTNPYTTLGAIKADRLTTDAAIVVLLVAAGTVLLANLPGLLRGVAELFEEPHAKRS